jgi:hypothetical protein
MTNTSGAATMRAAAAASHQRRVMSVLAVTTQAGR